MSHSSFVPLMIILMPIVLMLLLAAGMYLDDASSPDDGNRLRHTASRAFIGVSMLILAAAFLALMGVLLLLLVWGHVLAFVLIVCIIAFPIFWAATLD